MKFIPFLAAGLIATTAFAHTDEYLDTQPTPHGGQMRMAGPLHYELVVARDGKATRDNPVVVHVTDHAGNKVPTAGASGTAMILAGKERVTVKLLPDGENRLKGSGNYASTPDMKVVVSVTLPGKPPEQARFTPLVKAAAGNMHAGH